jgi:hypothetical protein
MSPGGDDPQRVPGGSRSPNTDGSEPPSLDLLVFQRGGTAPDLEALI